MKVLIVGAGKLGYKIATAMSFYNTDITVMDTNEELLSRINDHLDVLTVKANGVELSSLQEIGIKDYDLTIAATGSDETNIIISTIVKRLGCKRVIARVRDPEYVQQQQFIQNIMDIDYAVNPERATAKVMARYLLKSCSFYTNRFAEGRISLIDVPSHAVPHWLGKQLMEINDLNDLVVVAIGRSGDVIIPNGSTEILKNDVIYVLGNTATVDEFIEDSSNSVTKREIKKVMIIGGGRLGLYLAELLDGQGVQVKIIERSAEQCRYLAEALSENVLVLCGDGADINMLHGEEFSTMDAFVGATGYDEENLLMTLVAKNMGVPKVVAKVSKESYINIIEKLGVDVAMSTVDITASDILRFVRGGPVLSVSLILGGKAEVTELVADKTMPIVGKPLFKLDLPKGVLVGAVLKGNSIIIPNGQTIIEEGDRFIIFCLSSTFPKASRFLRSSREDFATNSATGNEDDSEI